MEDSESSHDAGTLDDESTLDGQVAYQLGPADDGQLSETLIQTLDQSSLENFQALTSIRPSGQNVTLANKINVKIAGSNVVDETKHAAPVRRMKNAQRIFVKTRGYDYVLGALEDQGHVVIAGSPGSGKTTMSLYLMHEYSKRNYKLRFVKTVKDFDFEKDVNIHHDTLLVFDDVFNHAQHALMDHMLLFEDIEEQFRYIENKESESAEKGQTKVLFKVVFTARTNVLKRISPHLNRFRRLFRPSSVVNLVTTAKLDLAEKQKVLTKHLKEYSIELEEEELEIISNEEYGTLGFPYICKLFVENRKQWKSAVTFFKNPTEYLNMYIKSIFNDTDFKHTASVMLLILLNDGEMDLSRITDVLSYKEGQIECLYNKLSEIISGLTKNNFLQEIKEAASHQVHTFLINEGDVVKFSHPTIHDVVTFVVGSKDPTFVLRYCPLTFLIDHVKVKRENDKQLSSGNEYDYTIDLQRESAFVLVERLAKEVGDGNFALSLSHSCLRDHSLAQYLFTEITTKGYLKQVLHSTDTKYRLHFLFWISLTCNNTLCQFVLDEETFERSEIVEAVLGNCMSGNTEGINMLIEHSQTDMVTRDMITTAALSDILPQHEQTKHTICRLSSLYDNSHEEDVFDLNAPRMHGERRDRLIHIATANGHTGIVTILLGLGADINTKGGTGMTPLMYACYLGYTELAQELIDRGADVNLLDDENDNCLHLASRAGFSDVVRALLTSEIDINSRGFHGRTPLLFASQHGKEDVVKLLLEKGAETEPDTALVSLKDTCLNLAAENGHTAIVEELIENGKMHIETVGLRNRTALMSACRHGHLETALYLKSKHANILALDDNKFNCLHLAAMSGNVATVTWLLTYFDKDVCNEFMRTPLMYAILRGHDETAQLLLRWGESIQLFDRTGSTCIHFAARSGSTSLVEKCINLGQKVNSKTHIGYTPLMNACQSKHLAIMKYLLSNNADITSCNGDGNTCLHIACTAGNLDVVQYLHENYSNEIDINKPGFQQKTPIILACSFGHHSVVKYLVDAGADHKLTDQLDRTCSHAACFNGKLQVVRLLRDHGLFESNAVDAYGTTPFLSAAASDKMDVITYLQGKEPSLKEQKNKQGQNALHIACSSGSMSCVKKLIQVGIKVNALDSDMRTPLILAVCSKKNIVDVVSVLIMEGADTTLRDRTRATCLHAAIKTTGHVSMTEALLDMGTDVNMRGAFDETPIMLACKHNVKDYFDLLLRKGADVNLVNENGSSSLHLACMSHVDDTYIASKLLQKNQGYVNWYDDHGKTPIMYAVSRGREKTVKLFIQEGANVTAFDKHGNSLLHIACRCQNVNINIIKLLLHTKLDANTRDNFDQTPVMFAAQYGHEEAIQLLVVSGADLSLADGKNRNATDHAQLNGHYDVVDMLSKTMQFHFHTAVKSDKTDLVEFMLIMQPWLKSSSNERGQNALHIACFFGAGNTVTKLIKAGIDVNDRDSDMRTPLILAVCSKKNIVDVVSVLIMEGADTTLRDRTGATCLHAAVKTSGHVSMTEALLDMGTDVNMRGAFDETPIMLACKHNVKDYFDLFLRKGANVNLDNVNGSTSLHLACMNSIDDTNIVSKLLQRIKSYVNWYDDHGKTPIMYAVSRGREKTMKLLVWEGANPILLDKHGNSLLHIACRCQKADINIVMFLLHHGLYVNSRDKYGQTPVMIAAQNGHEELIELFVVSGADLFLFDGENRNCIDHAVLNRHYTVADKLLAARWK